MRGPQASRAAGGPGRPRLRSAASSWDFTKAAGVIFVANPEVGTTLSGSKLTSWTGAGGAITQATDAKRMTLDAAVTIGGRPTVKRDASVNQEMTSATGGAPGNVAHWLFTVARADTLAAYRSWLGFGSTGNCAIMGICDSSQLPTTGAYWIGGTPSKTTPTGDQIKPTPRTAAPVYSQVAIDTTIFHPVAISFDGTTVRLYVDGYLSIIRADGNPATPVSDTRTASAGYGFFEWAADFGGSAHHGVSAWGTGAMVDADRHRAFAYARTHYSADANVGAPWAQVPNIVCVCDSLSHGTGATVGTTDYPTQMIALLSKTATVWNLGVPGQTVVSATAAAQCESDIAAHLTDLAPTNVAVVWGLTNDLINGASYAIAGYDATAYANLLTYLATIRSYAPTGTKLVVCTLIHCKSDYSGVGNQTAFNAMIDLINVRIRAGAAANNYATADLGAEPKLDANITPATSFDGLHLVGGLPGQYGYAVAAQIVATTVNALI